ncbi:MAG: asparagine synthase (glutamine-hydrolyzing), partial [Bacteroidota bacterium]
MCGIAGVLNLNYESIPQVEQKLGVFNQLLQHRGPDGQGAWTHPDGYLGMAHQRLSIIDIAQGDQPMVNGAGNVIVFNGEIYNYVELREELAAGYRFKTNSDTEVILAAYEKWGADCLDHLRGMFAFALWDERKKRLFCARDRFGIKPFYYARIGDHLYFASEPKGLLPFLPEISTDRDALKDYFVFQLCLGGKTLFKDVQELLRAHRLIIENGAIQKSCYWEIFYNLDWDHTKKYFQEQLQDLMEDSMKLHLRADVPIGAYVSGGVDSSIVASMASRMQSHVPQMQAFTGKFDGALYDESEYARALANGRNIDLHELRITSDDFLDNIRKVIYHLDYPVAGPGSFPQYMISELAAKHVKVVLGGQGGDEIFGGYTRYLIAYFEQCIKGAMEGTLNNGNFVVTYESIIPNLTSLRNYKPLLKTFWAEGLFEDIDKRYFRLINRAPSLDGEVRWEELGSYKPYDTFSRIFNGRSVGQESYFDKMTHYDFKTLLPALLQVEDRMSMAHGLESRVPFLDHPIVELAATIPADSKFKDGKLKKLLIETMQAELPDEIIHRKDKMGFPVPLNDWTRSVTDVKDFIQDTFRTQAAKARPYMNHDRILAGLEKEGKFGRKLWGLLSL